MGGYYSILVEKILDGLLFFYFLYIISMNKFRKKNFNTFKFMYIFLSNILFLFIILNFFHFTLFLLI